MSLHEIRNPNICMSLIRSTVAIWLMMFRYQGLPPRKGSRYPLFFAYAAASAIDLLLTAVICIHIMYPISNLSTVGIPFLLALPLTTLIGPLLGALACFSGRVGLLKLQSACNSTSVLFNYPLTIGSLIYHDSDPFYVAVVVLLIVNKIVISFTSTKVAQHWQNPGFSRNSEKVQDSFKSLIQTQSEASAGVKAGMSASNRASNFVNSGLPETYYSLSRDQTKES